jgi:hypothetical protein
VETQEKDFPNCINCEYADIDEAEGEYLGCDNKNIPAEWFDNVSIKLDRAIFCKHYRRRS